MCLFVVADDPGTKHPSATHLYEVINNLCSEHLDTHHHFFIASSNTYVRLDLLLGLANRLGDSTSLWLGKLIRSTLTKTLGC